ncbi:MAG: DNA-binding response regulator, partial [Spirochaetes bacterium]
MRILIADDETLVRYGLVSVLQDLLPQSTEIIEAGSGVELVEKTREYHPHIAFVDI